MADAVSKSPEPARPLAPRPRQFRLITLFAVMLAVCVPLTWLAIQARHSRERDAAEKRINELGGRVEKYFGWPATVDLDHAPIKDDELVLLAEFSSLEYLFLGGTPITDAGLVHIGRLDNVGWLDLRDTAVTDAGLEHLKGLRKLRMLRFTGSKITLEGFMKLKESIPELETDKTL